MISVKEAEKIIFDQELTLEAELIPLLSSLGKVLAEDLIADRPFPPFDRVTMDGLALNISQNLEPGSKMIVEHIHFAGDPIYTLKDPQKGIEVMTGAVLPIGTNTVVPYEDLKRISKNEFETLKSILPDKNIHKIGIDAKEGSILVSKFHKINGPVLAVAASVGKTQLSVLKPLKVAIVSTGNELVDVGEPVLPYQIRRSNAYAIYGILAEFSPEVGFFHINDDEDELKLNLSKILKEHQVLILSGGVSMGQKDLIPNVLIGLGVKNIFHKIAQKPGKPLWFGKTENVLVFGCPGNPSSTTLCTVRYIKPWFKKYYGQKNLFSELVLNHDIVVEGTLTRFLQVKKEGISNLVSIIKNNGSGDFINLTEASGFIELEPGNYKAGHNCKFWEI